MTPEKNGYGYETHTQNPFFSYSRNPPNLGFMGMGLCMKPRPIFCIYWYKFELQGSKKAACVGILSCIHTIHFGSVKEVSKNKNKDLTIPERELEEP